MREPLVLTGSSLTIDDVVSVARGRRPVRPDPQAMTRVASTRRVIDEAIGRGETIYGVNTGFGKLAHVRIDPQRLAELQVNLIRSHAAGLGEPLTTDVVRAMMLLRTNVLLRGTSGVRPELPGRLIDLLNAGIHPRVPEQGSVGASGDLAPLSHLALALIGEGDVAAPDGGWQPAATALREAGLAPLQLAPKEGLAFINGTQAQTGLAALLLRDSWAVWNAAHTAAAMSLEAVRGTPVPFDARIHDARPHPEQQRSAALLRRLLAGSEIRESHREGDPRVQDAYSLRCTPQVLGAVGEAFRFAERLVVTELNAATDNPLVIDGEVLSGGNFHGAPIALALDVLAMALATMAGLSERRLERVVNPDLSSGLPPFLARNPGLESGFMTAQITAAALAAESRVLATPASVQSIPTEGNQEDFVPMGMTAGWKARRVLGNAARIVAVELLAAAEGLEFLKPLRPGHGVAGVLAQVRGAGFAPLAGDRSLSIEIERCAQLVLEGRFAGEES